MNFLKIPLSLAQSALALLWTLGLTYFLLSYLEQLWSPPWSAYAVQPMLAFWASQIIVFFAAGVRVGMSRWIRVLWVLCLWVHGYP